MDRVWAGDITFVPTREGWLYLAILLDLYSRRVVGWAMSGKMKQALVNDALLMASNIDNRNPGSSTIPIAASCTPRRATTPFLSITV